jgi:16S rRNA (cytosine1402-N4)-methyltransferase
MKRPYKKRSTPEGEHRPVLIQEVLEVLNPAEGGIFVDCTLGMAGHSRAILERVGPTGQLIACDLDLENLTRAKEKLEQVGNPFHLHHGNFAGFPTPMGELGIAAVDGLLADLGMSSMQVDDPDRGFSHMREGPLDMRMDRERGKTAADLINTMTVEEMTEYFSKVGDEPDAEIIAKTIAKVRKGLPITTTRQLSLIIRTVAPKTINYSPLPKQPTERQQRIRPVARVFQTLRILVNRELANLQELLRVIPWCLKPGGKIAIISFHSGEDRLVKASFRDGKRLGIYSETSKKPIRPQFQERIENPRSRSAKMRWAVRSEG